jgi:hypothetical protein
MRSAGPRPREWWILVRWAVYPTRHTRPASPSQLRTVKWSAWLMPAFGATPGNQGNSLQTLAAVWMIATRLVTVCMAVKLVRFA